MLRVFAGRGKEARWLLSRALREIYGLGELPEIARLPRGKPWFPAAAHIRFNLSHSGSLALCAVSDGEVGVDMETVRPRRAGLPRFALTPAEYAEYLQNGGTWEAFYTLWTRKEAWYKYTGEGIHPHPSKLSVPDGALIRSYAGDGWRCAVCAAQPASEIEWIG